jgi:transcriptional regulator with XRE-family HTH domain
MDALPKGSLGTSAHMEDSYFYTDYLYFNDDHSGESLRMELDSRCGPLPCMTHLNTGRRERQEAGGFAARLRQVLKGHGSASGLAKAITRSEGAVRKWLRGESEPNVTDLRALSHATQTRLEWLVSGEGPQQLQPQAGPAAPDAASLLQHSSHGALDLPLLEAVMAAAEEQLRIAGLDLPPVKRSALIAAAYDLARERGGVEAQTVARLVRLAR